MIKEKEKRVNDFDKLKFEDEKLNELQWYTDKLKLNINVYKVVNLNEKDYEDKDWRPALEFYKTYENEEATKEDKNVDMIIFKTETETLYHLLTIRNKECK